MITGYKAVVSTSVMLLFTSILGVSYQAQGKTSLDKSQNALDASGIDTFIQENLPNAVVGVFLQDPKTGKVLYQYNANKTFSPASSLKIFTSAVAIQVLGPDYQFNTLLQTDRDSLQSIDTENPPHKLIKNLYIQFNGDPSLTTADLKKLITDTLKKYQIRKISGKVILDTTQYQAPHYPYGWSWEDLAWYFAAPVTSVILDENAVKLKIKSNKELGGKAEVLFAGNAGNADKADGNKSYVALKSTVISVTPEMAENECSIQVAMDQKNSAVLSGCWPQHPEPDNISLAVQNPTFIAETVLRETLDESKIQWSNEIELRKTPTSVSLLAEHSSKPLKELLKPVLEDSNNIYAESLLKTLGLKKLGEGSFLAGLRVMKAALTDELGLKINEFKIEDGSGGSRYTQITPNQMGLVLNKIYQSPTLFPIFWELLPKWGQSGTLKTRTNDSVLANAVRAKTGYMTGVSTLSGYLTPDPQRNNTLIFVIMINNTIEKHNKLKEFQEKLLLHLLSQYRIESGQQGKR